MPFASVGYYFPSYLGGLSLRQTWLMWSLRKWRFLRLQAETFIEAVRRRHYGTHQERISLPSGGDFH